MILSFNPQDFILSNYIGLLFFSLMLLDDSEGFDDSEAFDDSEDTSGTMEKFLNRSASIKFFWI